MYSNISSLFIQLSFAPGLEKLGSSMTSTGAETEDMQLFYSAKCVKNLMSVTAFSQSQLCSFGGRGTISNIHVSLQVPP